MVCRVSTLLPDSTATRLLHLVVLGVVLASSCKSDSFKGSGGSKEPAAPPPALQVPPPGAKIERFSAGGQPNAAPVDLLFMMDTSGSMRPKQQKLESSLAALASRFVSTAQNVDYQIFMVGDRFNFPQNVPQNKFAMVNMHVDSHDALKISAQVLSGSFSANLRLRPEANKELVIITDDEAYEVDANAFKQLIAPIRAQLGKLHVHGIIGLRQQGGILGGILGGASGDCNIPNVGTQYQALSNDPEFRGLIQDVCAPDWGPLIDNLALKVIETRNQTKYPLQQGRPVNPAAIQVVVNGAPLPPGSFSYLAAENAIVFPDASAPPAGSTIEINYP